MSKDTENFSIDLTADDIAKLTPNAGGGFQRIPFGDYRLRITDAVQQAKTGDKPHVMLKPTFAVVAAHDPANNHAIGMSTDGLYAGSKASPKYMQDRLANLLKACAIQLKPGQGLSKSMLVGREFDASITWELSAPKFNEQTGQQVRYVNSRVIGERPVGQPRHTSVNPERDSAVAAKYLEEKYGDAGGGGDAPETDAPWAQAGAQPGTETQAQPETQAPAGFRPEAEADATVMQYRAYIKLETPYAEQARTALEGAGFDPDGPVTADLLPEPIRAQYLTKFPPQTANGTGLPPLGGLPPAGGAPAPRKGTRSKQA